VKVSQPFFAVVTVCEATRGLLSPGCQCDRVPLLLLPLSSGFLFVVPNYMYIYSLLSMFVGIFLSRVSLLVVPVVGTFFGLKGLIVIVYYSSVLGSH
jgi:hypothetical protein